MKTFQEIVLSATIIALALAPTSSSLAVEQQALLPTASEKPVAWQYTTQRPADEWFQPEFDDGQWKQGPITDKIDASLFMDDDGKVYFVWQNGLIARMNDEMTDLAGKPRLLKPSNYKHVGFEGAYLTNKGGKYYLICADFIGGDYHCMVATADEVYGPYGPRYLAVPHGGHNMFFTDEQGNWWATFFGNDARAPFRERPAILRIELDDEGRVRVKMP